MGTKQGRTIGVAGALFLLIICSRITCGQTTTARQVYRLNLPDKNWAMDVSLRDLTVDSEVSEGLSYGLLAGRRPTKNPSHNIFLCRLSMSPAQGSLDAIAVRNFFKKNRKTVGEVKSSEHNEIPIIEYRLAPSFGTEVVGTTGPPSLRVMEAFWVYEQTWIILSLSFMGSINSDGRAFFLSLIGSVRFVNTSNPINSFDFYQKGRAFYVRHEYATAAKFFNVAMEMEKKKRELENDQWTHLIMELADSYGATGQLGSFKQLLDYAVREKPSEYLFHWALARYYANMGDLNNAIDSLRMAYKNQPAELRKQKIKIGLHLVDPLSDKAFERFHKVEEFRKAVKEMQEERD